MSNISASLNRDLPVKQRQSKRLFILFGILIAFAPILFVGVIGERIGDGTTLGGALINLAYVMSVLAATAVLKWFGSSWREIGLARPASWPKTLLLGLGTAVGYIIVALLFQALLQAVIAPDMGAADRSSYNPIVGNLPLLLLMVTASWTTIAFGEEMMFRAFLTNSLAGLFPQSKARWVFALIGSSLLFGIAHLSWGVAGVVETTILGLFLGLIYLRTGRNLWITIIAHGLLNTLSFSLIYAGVIS